MFVEAHVALPMSAAEARQALADVLRAHTLGEPASGAYADGIELLVRVGPRDAGGGVSKQVRVHLLEPRMFGLTQIVPLRWEATGAGGGLFPALDANLGVTPASEDSTLLSIVGRYEPPLGPLGKTLDHALLARVGDATAKSFLRRMAAILQACVEARATGEALTRTSA